MAVIITAGFVPLRASAYSDTYTYRITSLGQKKTVTQKRDIERYNDNTYTYAYTYYMYKINVPANGYLRIASSASSKAITIYKSIDKTKEIDWQYENNVATLKGSRVYYRILPRGYYYIQADPGTKFNWSFNRKKAVYNYCRARAVGLKAGAKTGVFFTCGYEYDRWYKVSLTRNKTITVTFNQLDIPESYQSYLNEFDIYDSRGTHVNCPELTKTSYRTGSLRKGTYYIRVRRHRDENENYDYKGRIVQLMWR